VNLFLARHGQTDLNVGDHYQGSSNLPLNDLGRQQARDLARAVPAVVEQVVVSPQLRAQQTAAPLIMQRGLPSLTMDAFRERHFGVWEGKNPTDARALDPAFFDRGGLFSLDEAPPEAEPMAQLIARTGEGLRQVYAAFRDNSVLLVVHGFVIRALRYQLENMEPADLKRMPRPLNGELFHYAPAQVAAWAVRNGLDI